MNPFKRTFTYIRDLAARLNLESAVVISALAKIYQSQNMDDGVIDHWFKATVCEIRIITGLSDEKIQDAINFLIDNGFLTTRDAKKSKKLEFRLSGQAFKELFHNRYDGW